jgi:hypothetical protein
MQRICQQEWINFHGPLPSDGQVASMAGVAIKALGVAESGPGKARRFPIMRHGSQSLAE